ncbi:stage II sporulation protein M [Cohnella lubricantis]|uniref:Stage II sporulation protein M n=1 Tax=Cohnella lubricantis TaxID=2163172 RepID=A0A841TGZ7_9BACL|nr:stage II sporulation protein M [Cohnella lubricantis]MBB6679199.1 stage II sporulation protein M [Cohnella lubricantis]MBP2119529.1 stage II sporulation protein M [Cohnella lubricantis]
MFSKQALHQNWRDIKPYLIFAFILFFASLVVGASSTGPVNWLDEAIESVRRISESAESSNNPEQTLFTAIWLNNVRSSLMSLYLGLFAGVMPIVTLVVNGMLMGYLFGNFAAAGYQIGPMIVKGILPHGILEIPALMLACAFGVRLGLSLLRGIWGSLIGRNEPWARFKLAIKGSVPAAILVVLLLLIAAVIESTVTYRLMEG